MVQDKQVGIGSSDAIGSVWLHNKLDWDYVQNVKARINGSLDHVPLMIDGIELMQMSRQLIAWWMEVRGDALMPSPTQIDHKALVELLPYFRMLRWESEDSLVIRLLGTVIVEVSGVDFTGLDVFADKDLPGMVEEIERYKLIHAHPCGLLLRRGLPRRDGSTGLIEILSLPVSADADGKTRVIGTVAVCNQWTDAHRAIRACEPIVNPLPVLQRAAFIDLGFGLPDAATRLSF